eukprot:TRINITY_DN11686_c0_g6_i1.p1 TRINITY_DN11686_c0_g6~~TRINITY_DN11686_c0_g6_i1.p1  ORF type:complete len:365 (+),score=63.75 TRINITY_DN11686_c0_g6_i1:1449-2543(+)
MYHIFCSYRHGEWDSAAVKAFVTALWGMAVGTNQEIISVFLDELSLPRGEQFDSNFMQAMTRSLIVTPIVSLYALEGMMDLANLMSVDNVLMEWWLALILNRQVEGCVYKVLPIFVGSVRDSACLPASVSANNCLQLNESQDGILRIGNLFKELDLHSLPDAVNEPTFIRLERFFANEAKGLSHVEVTRMTVREVVGELFKFHTGSGCLSWQVYNDSLKQSSLASRMVYVSTARLEVDRVTARCADVIFKELELYVLPKHLASKQAKLRSQNSPRPRRRLPKTPTARVAPRSCATADATNRELLSWLHYHKLDAFMDVCQEDDLSKTDLKRYVKFGIGHAAQALRVKRTDIRLLASVLHDEADT